MKTKLSYLIVLLLLTNSAFAQYFINDDAPVNEIIFKYHKDHFKLKGEVKEFKDSFSTYTFNREGYLIKDKSYLGLVRNYEYDSNNNLVRMLSYLSANSTPVIYNIETDNKKRVTRRETSYNSGDRYVYDSRGNLLEKHNLSRKELEKRNTYDNKGRLIKSEGFYNAINETSVTTYSYKKDGQFILVNRKYTSSNPERGNSTSKSYYKGGFYFGTVKSENLKYDSHGNPKSYLNENGSVSSEKSYVYFGEEIESNTPIAPNIPEKTKKKEGCITGNCSNGWGKKIFSHGSYTGFFSNSKRNGYGMFVWNNNGGKYIGFWENGDMTGYATFFGVNQDMIGQYIDGFIQGLGYIIKDDKFKYGEYDKSQLVKEYTYYKNTGVTTGCVSGNCVNQYGKMVWDNGDSFIGFFKDGNMFMGTYEFASGDKYEGMFNNSNQFHGQGRFFFKDGSYYAGEWSLGKYNGLGYLLNKDYSEKKGIWRNGELQKSM